MTFPNEIQSVREIPHLNGEALDLFLGNMTPEFDKPMVKTYNSLRGILDEIAEGDERKELLLGASVLSFMARGAIAGAKNAKGI